MAGQREVEKRIPIPASELAKDKAINAAVSVWWEAATAFDEARNASVDAKNKLLALLGPKLKANGWHDGVNWDVKKHPKDEGAIIVEFLRGEKGRVSKVPVETVTFR